MQINKTEFLRFLDLVLLSGDIENKEVILSFGDSIVAKTVSPSNIVAVKGELAIKDSDIKGEIGINNIKFFSGLIKNLSGEVIEIIKDNNILKCSDVDKKIQIEYILTLPEYITNSISEEKFSLLLKKIKNNKFTVSKDILKKIIYCVNSLKSDDLILKGKNKELVIETKNNDNKIIMSFEIKENVEEFTIKLSKILLNILNTINDEIIMVVEDKIPILINYKNSVINISYLLAPMKS